MVFLVIRRLAAGHQCRWCRRECAGSRTAWWVCSLWMRSSTAAHKHTSPVIPPHRQPLREAGRAPGCHCQDYRPCAALWNSVPSLQIAPRLVRAGHDLKRQPSLLAFPGAAQRTVLHWFWARLPEAHSRLEAVDGGTFGYEGQVGRPCVPAIVLQRGGGVLGTAVPLHDD